MDEGCIMLRTGKPEFDSCVWLGIGKKSTLIKVREIIILFKAF